MFAIDPLAEDIDLSKLWDLLGNESITKVFHAGRQDIEIFYHLTGDARNIFDTQIAAMVCGLGDQVDMISLSIISWAKILINHPDSLIGQSIP